MPCFDGIHFSEKGKFGVGFWIYFFGVRDRNLIPSKTAKARCQEW